MVVALAVATISGVLQIWYKCASRSSTAPGQRLWHLIKKDDYVLWSDFIIAGAVAFAAFLIKELFSTDGIEVNPWKTVAALALALLTPQWGAAIMGHVLYDSNGDLHPGWERIAATNVAGLVVLSIFVYGGANVG
ncbi:hypothetical protein [Nocardia gipuzkoensis]